MAPYPLPAPAVLPAAALYGSRESGTRCAVFLPMFPAMAASRALAVCRRRPPVATAPPVAFSAVSSPRTFPLRPPYSD